MIPTGSKLLLGGAVIATLAAIVYGIAQGGSLGTVGLIFAAASLAGHGKRLFEGDAQVQRFELQTSDRSGGCLLLRYRRRR